MTDPRIEEHARVLVRYSTGVKKGEVVAIHAPLPGLPLAEAVYREVLRAGGHPLLRLSPPDLSAFFYKHAKPHQLDYVGKHEWAEVRAQAARIVILAEDNPRALTNVPPTRLTRVAKARRPLKEHILKHVKWSLTLHPTRAAAQEAEMDLAEYEDFVYGALLVTDGKGELRDAVSAWKRHEKVQDRIARALRGTREVRIRGKDTDLRMTVAGRKWVPSPGKENLPSGEVFTAPVEDSVEGEVFFDCPTTTGGRLVEGVRLRFRKGKVVEASAARGEEYLKKVLATDPGAARLGELGIGTNYGIARPTKEILLDEKIGGTVHMALGSAYEECGGRNKSAIHWDLIKDLRPAAGGGTIEVDGEVIQKDGRFRMKGVSFS